jgi:hypothetical protein
MTISQPGARRRPAERRAPRLLALQTPSSKPENTVPEALQAVEDVKSELSPQTFEAMQAIIGAMVSLATDLQDARAYGDSLKAHLDSLEDRVETLARPESPAVGRARSRRPWTAEEDRRLVELTAQGHGLSRLAMHLDRSYVSVWKRSRQLGLTSRSKPDARAWARGFGRVQDRPRDVLRGLLERVAFRDR